MRLLTAFETALHSNMNVICILSSDNVSKEEALKILKIATHIHPIEAAIWLDPSVSTYSVSPNLSSAVLKPPYWKIDQDLHMQLLRKLGEIPLNDRQGMKKHEELVNGYLDILFHPTSS